MLKGCQRKMIMVRGDSESTFETAYFIVKPESEGSEGGENSMVEEAIRIVSESLPDNKKRRRKHADIADIFKFLAGFFSGCSIIGILWLVFAAF